MLLSNRFSVSSKLLRVNRRHATYLINLCIKQFYIGLVFVCPFYFQNLEDSVNYFDPDTYVPTFEITSSKSVSTILDDKNSEILSDSD